MEKTFQEILSHRKYFNALNAFAKRKVCLENISFYLDVEDYKKIQLPEVRLLRAKVIYDKFLSPESPTPVNLDEVVIDKINRKLKKMTKLLENASNNNNNGDESKEELSLKLSSENNNKKDHQQQGYQNIFNMAQEAVHDIILFSILPAFLSSPELTAIDDYYLLLSSARKSPRLEKNNNLSNSNNGNNNHNNNNNNNNNNNSVQLPLNESGASSPRSPREGQESSDIVVVDGWVHHSGASQTSPRLTRKLTKEIEMLEFQKTIVGMEVVKKKEDNDRLEKICKQLEKEQQLNRQMIKKLEKSLRKLTSQRDRSIKRQSDLRTYLQQTGVILSNTSQVLSNIPRDPRDERPELFHLHNSNIGQSGLLHSSDAVVSSFSAPSSPLPHSDEDVQMKPLFSSFPTNNDSIKELIYENQSPLPALNPQVDPSLHSKIKKDDSSHQDEETQVETNLSLDGTDDPLKGSIPEEEDSDDSDFENNEVDPSSDDTDGDDKGKKNNIIVIKIDDPKLQTDGNGITSNNCNDNSHNHTTTTENTNSNGNNNDNSGNEVEKVETKSEPKTEINKYDRDQEIEEILASLLE